MKMSGVKDKKLPVLLIEAETLGGAWIKAVLDVWNKGFDIRTEYGGLSKDATVMIHVTDPFKEPRAHIADYITYSSCVLKKDYVEQILNGTLDDKIGKGGVAYTYHDRLFKYKMNKDSPLTINQIDKIVEKLKEVPYSRRAQAITWYPDDRDWGTDSPPCLQRVWCRIIGGRLVMEITWRSRDLFHAWGANAYAMTELQRKIAEELGVEVGQYIDFSNSLHIYEKNYKELQRTLETFEKRKANK